MKKTVITLAISALTLPMFASQAQKTTPSSSQPANQTQTQTQTKTKTKKRTHTKQHNMKKKAEKAPTVK
ncbi:MAG TPA: hypothetical protein VN428_27050 [Bryobacteraceae bacterium]|nr:hypothetical protein [Bryobacteraceae bacterium]